MVFVLLTSLCYILSSLGDKHISAKLKFNTGEFAFIVSLSTAVWIFLTLPFTGWHLEINRMNSILLGFLVLWKILEFYTSAILLKTLSAYELKAWLGITIILSYLSNLYQGKTLFKISVFVFAGILLVGIFLIVKNSPEKKKTIPWKTILLCLLYIISKFLYGLMLGMMSGNYHIGSVLFVVMIITALLQLPRIHLADFVKRKGLVGAAATRIPNAIGLFTEALAAMENVFLYSLIQPVQLTVLFLLSLIKKEEMSKGKFIGSIFCILSICLITILVKI